MKMERINDNQIKFLLNKEDLKERNIKINELAYGSEKTQGLFREMMSKAMDAYNFKVDNTPLMIEAIPASDESIMIIVSKVDGNKNETEFSIVPPSRDKHKFIRKDLDIKPEKNDDLNKITIFSFKSLDDVSLACLRLGQIFTGTSFLFKGDGMYYLSVQNDKDEDCISIENIDLILSEYGQKHISTEISLCYLFEHYEIIAKYKAVSILAALI